MNKQQLANKIWATAQKMRSSKIEAQQYKDYLLGFIFYKFLSSLKSKTSFSDYTNPDNKPYTGADFEMMKDKFRRLVTEGQ